MKEKRVVLILLFSLLFVLATNGLILCGQNVPGLFERPGGLVPTKETALKIAEAVLVPIYGVKIMEDKPYQIKFSAGFWTIDGTTPPKAVGGSFHIVIRQRDAQVVEIGCGA